MNKFYKNYFGCDPELFIKKGKRVVASSIATMGKSMPTDWDGNNEVPVASLDGVQIELNPLPSYCREILRNNISSSIVNLDAKLKPKFSLSFEVGVKIPKRTLSKMPDDCKTFGCKPSYNVATGGESAIEADPSRYFFRSAGGHIHIGNLSLSRPAKDSVLHGSFDKLSSILANPTRLVPLLDTIVGNTCVIIDRDKANIERRKNYGRAGEYRLTNYGGLEYRTLSNFWLKAPVLFSFVFGLARMAVNIAMNNKDKKIMGAVDYGEVVRAINENDKGLAIKNWNKIKQKLVDFADNSATGNGYPINTERLKKVELFMSRPLSHWIGKNYVKNWTRDYANTQYLSFGDFIEHRIRG